MNTIIEKIRAEIERLKIKPVRPIPQITEAGYHLALNDVLHLLSDLEKEEKPSEGLGEEIREFVEQEWDGLHDNDGNPLYTADYLEYIAHHFYELGREHQRTVDADLGSPKYERGFEDGREYERKSKEQPVCEGLEEAAEEAATGLNLGSHFRFIEGFKAGAEWQKEQTKGKKWIFEDEYHKDMERSFQDGRDEMRKEMMENAVEAHVSTNGMGNKYLFPNYNDDFKDINDGDKVRTIIIKED